MIQSNELDCVNILVHNLSHADLVLSLNDLTFSLSQDEVIARPKFSYFREVTQILLEILVDRDSKCSFSNDSLDYLDRTDSNAIDEVETTYLPLYRHDNDITLMDSGSSFLSTQAHTAAGFSFRKCPLLMSNYLTKLRFRGKDSELLQTQTTFISESQGRFHIDRCYFPLISILLPKWLQGIKSLQRSESRKVLVLISGRGVPSDKSTDIRDNSTKQLGQLVTKFVAREYPEIEIIHLHSKSNLFRYDENVIFVKRDLLPLIDRYRNELALKVIDRWRDMMNVSLSFADGSSARISAIQSSLRHYRPQYFHYWQLKTFWRKRILCEDDIECHSFDMITTEPAISVSQLSGNLKLVVDEMQKFYDEFQRITNDNSIEHDLNSFWLRKSGKPVLTILLVQKPNEEPKLYRGTNVEVSMPTGSLCAERNVIGSALAADLSLRRQDLKFVAVFSAPTLELGKKPEYKNDTYKDNSNNTDTSDTVLVSSPGLSQKRKILSMNHKEEFSNSTSSLFGDPKLRLSISPRNSSRNNLNSSKKTRLVRQSIDDLQSNDIALSSNCRSRVREVDMRSANIGLEWCYETIEVEGSDMNPLKPCGACNEWLKKIAEVNPEFSVVTFTDSSRCGIFVEQITFT